MKWREAVGWSFNQITLFIETIVDRYILVNIVKYKRKIRLLFGIKVQ